MNFQTRPDDKNRRNDMGAENTEYGADQIQILEGLEAVRKRPGINIIHIGTVIGIPGSPIEPS